jgi:hypothetical protein
MNADTMPGDAEAAAAIAALTFRYDPRPGDRVRCPKAFGGGYQEGVIACPDLRGWLVDTPEGRLSMFTDELERI